MRDGLKEGVSGGERLADGTRIEKKGNEGNALESAKECLV